MQIIFIVIAAILLLIWLTGLLIGGLFHLLGWLFHLIPYLVVGLIVAALVSRLLSKRV